MIIFISQNIILDCYDNRQFLQHRPDIQFLQLFVRDSARRIQHHIPARIIFRERDIIADGVLPIQYCA